jgi:hypothetical protein
MPDHTVVELLATKVTHGKLEAILRDAEALETREVQE